MLYRSTCKQGERTLGFTIVELLIVIVVIGILAAITIVAYNGVQAKARQVSIQSDIKQVHKLIEAYRAENDIYPVTGTTTLVGANTANVSRVDANCKTTAGQVDWVPGLTQRLPQSDSNVGGGVGGKGGCYSYTSDGTSYILSAWNMSKSPQAGSAEAGYRRIGFREIGNSQFYYCNQANIGGNTPTPYLIDRDYYKYSYTITNISFCNETPPLGA